MEEDKDKLTTESDPRKGHHIFNNIPKLVRDTIDENYRKLPVWGHTNFEEFYNDVVMKETNGFSKDGFTQTWNDYKYWSPKSEVPVARDKLAMMSRPEGSIDTNKTEYSEAKKMFETAALNYLQIYAYQGEHDGELFSNVQAAAKKVQSNYVDEDIKDSFMESKETTQKDKDLCEAVKKKLDKLFETLPSHVKKWGLEMRSYVEVQEKRHKKTGAT